MSSVCLHNFFLQNDREIPVLQWNPEFLNRGKIVYEVIRVIRSIPLFLEDHLHRFTHSLAQTELQANVKERDISVRLYRLIELNRVSEGNIMFLLHFEQYALSPVFYAWFIPHSYPSEEDYRKGTKLILYHAERQNRQAKVLHMGMREAITEIISEYGAYEALLVDQEGYITEGSKSNFFSIRQEVVYTAPVKDVLPGITRKYIFRICAEKGIPIREEKVHIQKLNEMEACFISGTSPKILPANEIDSVMFSASNPLMKSIMEEYNGIIDDYIYKKKMPD